MRIKTFEKPTMAEVMEAVKAEMGCHAVILDVKEQKKGIFSPFMRPMATVVAASDLTSTEETMLFKKESVQQPIAPTIPSPPSSTTRDEDQQGSRDVFQKESLVRLSRVISQRLQPAAKTPPVAGTPTGVKTLTSIGTLVSTEMPVSTGIGAIYKSPLHPPLEMSMRMPTPIKTLDTNGECLNRSPRPIGGRGLLKALYNQVLEAGLDCETASHLFGLVVKKIAGDDFTQEMVTAYLRNLIREWIMRFAAPVPMGRSEKIVVLVGPTGVGKTTTLIKIAARLYQAKKKVTLVTMDTYRVGAVEQLRAYAEILGVPIRVIASAEALQHLWNNRQEGEYLLMDTAGRSPFHDAQLKQLTLLTEVPIDVHLTLSANTREADLHETLSSFSSVIPIDRLLFTKLDETQRRGSLFSVIRKGGVKPSYLTTGQRVPEDIEEATPDRIAEETIPLF